MFPSSMLDIAFFWCFLCRQTARHDKLRTLQKREAAKARMGRLQMILQQKLIRKYGTTK